MKLNVIFTAAAGLYSRSEKIKCMTLEVVHTNFSDQELQTAATEIDTIEY